MASFYSKPADYGTYTQPINLELVNFVMNSRQQKYDYNLAKIESKISDQLGNLDLARTQDKEYFLSRANEILGGMGDLSRLDWSKNGVTRQVDYQINSIIDDRVMNDVVSTKNYRAFQSTLKAKQAEGDGSYNPINAAYAMEKQGVNSWLKGEKDSVGQIQYQDYVDVGAELKEISENRDKYAREVTSVTDPTGQRYYKSIEGKILSSSEVKAIAEAQLSDRAKQQMQINGWANYDGGVRPKEEITKTFSDYAEGKTREIQDRIAALDLKMKAVGEGNPDAYKALAKQKSELEVARDKRQSTYDDWIRSGSTSNMTTTMENDRVLSQFGNTFAINDTKIELIENPYELAKYKEDLKRETERQKALADAQKKLQEEKSPFQTIVPTMSPDPMDRATELNRQVVRTNEGYKTAVKQVLATLDIDTRNNLEARYETEGQGMDKEAWMHKELELLGSKGSGIVAVDALATIEMAKIKRDKVVDMQMAARDYAFNIVEEENLDRLVGEMLDEDVFSSNQFEMLDKNGNKVSVNKYLKDRGVTTGQDLKNNPEVKKDLLKAIYAERLLDKKLTPKTKGALAGIAAGASSSFGAGAIGGGLVNALSDSMEGEEAEVFAYRLSKLFDGDEKAAAKYLSKAEEQGLTPQFFYSRNSDFFGTDYTFSDDSWVANWASEDKINTEVGKYLNDRQLTPTDLMVIVNKDSDEAQWITQQLNSSPALLSAPPGATRDPAQSYTLQDLGNGIARIYLQVKDKDGKSVTATADMPVANLHENLTRQIRFGENNRPAIDASNMQPVAGSAKFFEDTDIKGMMGLSRMTGVDIRALGPMVSKTHAVNNLREAYKDIMGTQTQPTNLGVAIENMLGSDNLKGEIVEVEGQFFSRISFVDSESGKLLPLHSFKVPIPQDQYNEYYFNTKYASQIMVYEELRKDLARVYATGGQQTPFIANIIKHYGGRVPN
jgi:hypothetical protein